MMASPQAEMPPLFDNLNFFLSANVPQKSWCAEQIKAHGGKVVRLEKSADILLVDPKKAPPPNSYSFKFIDRCLRAGKLLDVEEFCAGPAPGSLRPVGSTTEPPRAHRRAFTAKDDQILYDWVKSAEEKGEQIWGNKIYQQLQERHPQHTYQSWRDRYIRKVKDRPRPMTKDDRHELTESVPTPAQLEPCRERSTSRAAERSELRSSQERLTPFLESEENELLRAAPMILEIDPSRENDFWGEFAQVHGRHTATEWKNHFHTFIRPRHVRKKRSKLISSRKATPKKSPSTSPTKNGQQTPRMDEGTEATGDPNVNETVTTSVRRAQDIEISTEQTGEDFSKRRCTIAGEISTTSSHIPSASEAARRRLTDYNLSASAPRRLNITEISETPPQSVSSAHPRETVRSPTPSGPSIAPAFNTSVPPESAQPSRGASESIEQYETAPQVQSTQDIFANASQYVDELSELLNPTLPDIPEEEDESFSSQEIAENEKEEIRELDQWIDSRLRSGKAKDEEQIIQALSCTSMNPYLADIVLDSLNQGEGIPTGIQGVWTPEEDDLHGSANHSDIVKLQDKHGSENFDIRGRYLETVRQLQYEDL